MAKKEDFGFNADSNPKASLNLNLDFLNNIKFLDKLTYKQKEIAFFSAIIALVLVIAITVGCIIIGVNGGFSTNNSGGNNGDNGSDDNNTSTPDVPSDITSMYISAEPLKKVYYVHDLADYSGLSVYIMGADGSETFVKYDDYPDYFTITGFDSSSPTEEQTITVTFDEMSDTFTIKIISVHEDPQLISIELIPPTKLEYTVNDPFTLEGGYIVCTYDNGDIIKTPLLLDHVSGFEDIYTGPGEYEIKVVYRKGPVTLETFYTVTVIE